MRTSEHTRHLEHRVPEISVVVPAYREGDHLFRSIEVIVSELRKITPVFEIIVIDDGSPDNTWADIRKLAIVHPEIRGIRLSRNFGKEYALAAGLDHTKGKAVVIMDADLQHPPALIREFYSRWRSGEVDIVEGRKRNRLDEHWLRRVTSRMFNAVGTWLTGFTLAGASDFKLLDRKVVDAWRTLPERRCFYRGMVSWVGFRTQVIEFDVNARVSGASRWNAISLIRLAGRAIISFSSLPLKVIHLTSILFLLFALLIFARAVYLYFRGAAVGGATTIVALILITGGLGLGCLAVIAEYLAAIYEEVKGRPRYLVAEHTPVSSDALDVNC